MQQFLKQHENDEILLQFNSKMLVDQGYIKNYARFLENFEEKWREKVCAILCLDLDLVQMMC